MRPNGSMIRGRDIKVVSMKFIVDHDSEVVFFSVSTLVISRINIEGSLIDLFKMHNSLSIESTFVIVIILARVVVRFQGVRPLFILVMVVILGHSNISFSIQHLGHVIVGGF